MAKLRGLFVGAALIAAVPFRAQAQTRIAVGPVFPTGKLGNVSAAGFGFSLVNVSPIGATPLSFRLLAAYNRFRFTAPTSGIAVGHAQSPSYVEITGGLEFENPLPSAVSPFANIGWGYFHADGNVPSRLIGGDGKVDHFGGSVGGGVKIPLGLRDLIIEGRYVTMAGGDKYIPVSVGISF
jgi:hypothetical protein